MFKATPKSSPILDFIIPIPRNPHKKSSHQQSYLDWRHRLSQIQSELPHLQITPFEKNIEIWKQLWIVLDQSDFVLQVVDIRDPMFYLSLDLFQYASELGKGFMLIVNKSDLVGEEVRRGVAQQLE